MAVYLHHIETLLPAHSYAQSEIAATLKTSVARGNRRIEKVVHQLYSHSDIDRRYSVVGDFTAGAAAGAFYDPESRMLRVPTTEVRNSLYTASARQMFPELARRAFANSLGFEASDADAPDHRLVHWLLSARP